MDPSLRCLVLAKDPHSRFVPSWRHVAMVLLLIIIATACDREPEWRQRAQDALDEVHLPPEYVLIDEYTEGEGGSPIRVYEHRGSSTPDPNDLILAEGYRPRPYPHRDYRSWVGSLESFVDWVSFADYEGPAPDGAGSCHVAANVSVDHDPVLVMVLAVCSSTDSESE